MSNICPHMESNGDSGIRGLGVPLPGFHELSMKDDQMGDFKMGNFYQTIITIGQRINCPCLLHNIRTVNRMYKVVFGKNLPEDDTDSDQNEYILKNKIKKHYVALCEKAGEIVHADKTSEHAKKIFREFDRVYVVHRMVC